MHSIEKLFIDIHKFLIDYVKVLKLINENSMGRNTNILTIKLSDEAFLLPATFNSFSQRADELKNCLQRQIRILAQKRRKNILKGIDIDEQTYQQIESYKFDTDFKIHLEQLQNKISDKNMRKIIRYIQVIMDSLDLYDDILTKRDFLNATFRLLPVLQNIQKQLCCISINIQQILDDNAFVIEEHLRTLQQKLNSYDKDMRNKLDKYISRDIRPPVLVIPCPTNIYSPEIFAKIKSSNAIADDNDSDQNIVQITSISSEDSLSMQKE